MRFFTVLLLYGLFLLTCGLQAQEPKSNVLTGRGYQKFSEALVLSQLRESLRNAGDFTVFAPSDEAFQTLDEGLLLLNPHNIRKLRTLISYHIVAGEYTASRILQALCKGEGVAVFTTIQGEELIATMEGVDIVLTDCRGNKSRIVEADNTSENLVLHEIDRVILPGSPIP
jgi:uncharacterized surface protein with fasciclin (FAS1) repeats